MICCTSVFRYDAESRQRLKTVELIVEKTPWAPPQQHYAADQIVPLRINPADMQARLHVKSAGGKWDPSKRLWFIRYGTIAGTTMEKHIQVDTQ